MVMITVMILLGSSEQDGHAPIAFSDLDARLLAPKEGRRPGEDLVRGNMRDSWLPVITLLLVVPSTQSFLGRGPRLTRSPLHDVNVRVFKHAASGAAVTCSSRTTSTTTATATSTTAASGLGIEHVHGAKQTRPTRARTAASPIERLLGGEILSMGIDEVSNLLGGSGRARMVWNAFAAGVNPWSEEGKTHYLTAKTSRSLETISEGLPWEVVQESVSACGTRKLLVRLEDGLEVETVVIPCLTGARSTVCVSSQIGCAKACQFCMTGKMGLVRNLTAAEILGQVFFARQTVRQHAMPPLTNAVFMGMGEPMDNPAAVQQSLEVLTHPHAFAMAKSKISVSTVGPSPGAIKKMISMPARLAWSVHAAADEVRRLLVPTTVYSMVELRDAFAEVLKRKGREHLFVEVVLVQQVNDTPELARALAALLKPLPTRASINLLPLNDTGHPLFRASSRERVLDFQRVLSEEGFVATIRTARGDKRSSACGQLATSSRNERASREGGTAERDK